MAYRDGNFIMVMKGDDIHREGRFRIQLVGHADRAAGPFVFQKKPIYDQEQTEDACIWYNREAGLFNSLFHVMGRPVLARLVSDDGVQWRAADPFTFMEKELVLSDGTTWKPKRVERPFVLTDEKGRPDYLYIAVSDGGLSGNIAVPLRTGDGRVEP